MLLRVNTHVCSKAYDAHDVAAATRFFCVDDDDDVVVVVVGGDGDDVDDYDGFVDRHSSSMLEEPFESMIQMCTFMLSM